MVKPDGAGAPALAVLLRARDQQRGHWSKGRASRARIWTQDHTAETGPPGQEYEAKIKPDDLILVAEVVRDLYRSPEQPDCQDRPMRPSNGARAAARSTEH